MGCAAIAVLFFVFFLPELKGRSLEEVDELFEQKLWAWQFENAKTHGIGHRIAHLREADGDVEENARDNEAKVSRSHSTRKSRC